MWRRKVKKHAKRKANISAPSADNRRKIEESSLDLEDSSPGRRVRLVSDSVEGESSRKVVCVSDSKRSATPEPGLGLTRLPWSLTPLKRLGVQSFSGKLQKLRIVKL